MTIKRFLIAAIAGFLSLNLNAATLDYPQEIIKVSDNGFDVVITKYESGYIDTELNRIDDSVIDAAIKADGVITLPDNVMHEGISYDIVRITGIMIDVEGIKTVILPKHVKYMDGCFENCQDLSTIVFNEELESMIFSMNNLQSLTDLTFPETTFSIGELCLNSLAIREFNFTNIGAIMKCSCSGWPNVKCLVFPSNFGSTELETFCGLPNLEEIILPETSGLLSPQIFLDCKNVRKIYARSTTPPALGDWGILGQFANDDEGIFSEELSTDKNFDKSTCLLYVPEGAETAYQNDEYWGRFKNIIGYDYSGLSKVRAEEETVDQIHVINGEISIPENIENVTISDINGRCVYTGNNVNKINVSVAPGIYIIRAGDAVKKLTVR